MWGILMKKKIITHLPLPLDAKHTIINELETKIKELEDRHLKTTSVLIKETTKDFQNVGLIKIAEKDYMNERKVLDDLHLLKEKILTDTLSDKDLDKLNFYLHQRTNPFLNIGVLLMLLILLFLLIQGR
jgi:hypothetical protein